MNVRINASGLEDKNFVTDVLIRSKEIENKTIALESEILKTIDGKLGN
jgi:glutamate formiminotransferase/formiminotetrahydrofolate cyclodeaminase